jgi:hypothetical protein
VQNTVGAVFRPHLTGNTLQRLADAGRLQSAYERL